MNNTPWTQPELDAALRLPFPEFSALYPERSRHAWRLKTADINKGYRPVEKVKPQVEKLDPADDPRIADLMQDPDDARYFEKYAAYHDENLALAPRLAEIKVTLPVDDWVIVANMSDWHIGAEGCDIRRLKADIDLIASHPNIYVGLGGDLADNFILGGKMTSAVQASDLQVKHQWRLARYLLRPLLESDSLLWVGSGNHDQWTIAVSQADPVLAALKDVAIQYTGNSYISEAGFIDLVVGRQTYVFYRKHRPTRFNSSFNSTHWLKQTLRGFLPREWDIGVVEHLHTPATEVFTYRRRKRIGMCIGSYKIEDSYALAGGFYDGGYGVPCVLLSPYERHMMAFDSIQEALFALDGPMKNVKVVD